ncbi:hypothetical protein B4U80_14161, partial [Leptotrombidium deliense]
MHSVALKPESQRADCFDFEMLPNEMKTEVLSKLDENELLNCRLVSQKWKCHSDYTLRKRRISLCIHRGYSRTFREFVILRRNVGERYPNMPKSKQSFEFICSMFPYTREVIVLCTQTDNGNSEIRDMLNVCRERLKRVEVLKICDETLTAEDCCLLGATFPYLKHITLDSLQLSNEIVSKLLHSLTYVTSVQLYAMQDISDVCFNGVANRIEKLVWSHNDIQAFTGKQKFAKLTSLTLVNTRLGELWSDVLPNLKIIKIKGTTIDNFDAICFQNLTIVALKH